MGFGSSAAGGSGVNITIQLQNGSTVLYNDNMSNYVAIYGNHGSASFSGTATTDNPVLTFIFDKISSVGNIDVRWDGFTYSSCASDVDGDGIETITWT